MCLFGPVGRVGRPPGVSVVLGVARDLGARARARPGRSASPCRRARHSSASTLEPLGLDRPFLGSSRASASAGPRRRRPRRPRRAPRGRPSSRPTAARRPRASGPRGRARHTARRAHRRRRRAAAAPSAPPRPPCEAAVVDLEARKPGADAVMRRASRGRAARRSRGRRPRIVRTAARRRFAPAGAHPVGRPGTAREDSGRVRTRRLAYPHR